MKLPHQMGSTTFVAALGAVAIGSANEANQVVILIARCRTATSVCIADEKFLDEDVKSSPRLTWTTEPFKPTRQMYAAFRSRLSGLHERALKEYIEPVAEPGSGPSGSNQGLGSDPGSGSSSGSDNTAPHHGPHSRKRKAVPRPVQSPPRKSQRLQDQEGARLAFSPDIKTKKKPTSKKKPKTKAKAKAKSSAKVRAQPAPPPPPRAVSPPTPGDDDDHMSPGLELEAPPPAHARPQPDDPRTPRRLNFENTGSVAQPATSHGGTSGSAIICCACNRAHSVGHTSHSWPIVPSLLPSPLQHLPPSRPPLPYGPVMSPQYSLSPLSSLPSPSPYSLQQQIQALRQQVHYQQQFMEQYSAYGHVQYHV